MVYYITADAGSSKTLWVVRDRHGHEQKRLVSAGINAVLTPLADIEQTLQGVLNELADAQIAEVRYYGAGCAPGESCSRMRGVLSAAFGTEDVEVASDLLGAARGLLGNRPGIACILGTGSNSCLYDGREIVHNVPSLGYVLGDEGSGNALGRRMLSDALKGVMPRRLTEEILADYGLDVATAIDKVYRKTSPNRFLASLAPFAARHRDNDYIHRLLLDEFGRFLDRNVAAYKNASGLPLCFTGGIAFNFSDQLSEACQSRGYAIDTIKKEPF